MPDNDLTDQLKQQAHANEIKDRREFEKAERNLSELLGGHPSHYRRNKLLGELQRFAQKFAPPQVEVRGGDKPGTGKVESEVVQMAPKGLAGQGDGGGAPQAGQTAGGAGGLVKGLFNIQGELREVVFPGTVTDTVFD